MEIRRQTQFKKENPLWQGILEYYAYSNGV